MFAQIPDYWLIHGNPWEIERQDVFYHVRFGGHTREVLHLPYILCHFFDSSFYSSGNASFRGRYRARSLVVRPDRCGKAVRLCWLLRMQLDSVFHPA
jgi:hypothetical protein